MQINWCFKGIQENASFGDAEAEAVIFETGIESVWWRTNGGMPLAQANVESQNALNDAALNNHINNYALVRHNTPYISLSAGCNRYDPSGPTLFTAYSTAVRFATDQGSVAGYVFSCWTLTGLKRAPELPGFSEETRELNLYAGMYSYHDEGEVTAKLVVPRRQIKWVYKIDSNLNPRRVRWNCGVVGARVFNRDFVSPDRVSNVIEAI